MKYATFRYDTVEVENGHYAMQTFDMHREKKNSL